MLALALVLCAAPPLVPGVHRCGVQWSNYSELCTVTVDGATVTIKSEGPSARFSGKLTSMDENKFSIEGELAFVDIPIGYDELTVCDEKGPFRFRHTGKRKFFRHTQTCPDMTTTYFDIYIETVDPAKIETSKRLSAMANSFAYDRPGLCKLARNFMIDDGEDPVCVRWNDSGLGTPYYDCRHASEGRLYVFDTQKSCKELAQRKATSVKP